MEPDKVATPPRRRLVLGLKRRRPTSWHGEEELEQELPSSAAALGFSLLYSYHDGGGTGNKGDLGFWEAWRLVRHLYPGAVMNPEVHGWRGPQFRAPSARSPLRTAYVTEVEDYTVHSTPRGSEQRNRFRRPNGH
jgi:hypothetical protein